MPIPFPDAPLLCGPLCRPRQMLAEQRHAHAHAHAHAHDDAMAEGLGLGLRAGPTAGGHTA